MSKRPNFIGLDTQYPNANGEMITRKHFDGAASPLASHRVLETYQKLLPHYSNTHSHVHSSAQIMTKAFAQAQTNILQVLGADSEEYTVIFTGSGTTAGINRLVRGLHTARAEKPVVLISAMEHHANDLPHRQFNQEVHYIPLTGHGANQGAVDLIALENLLIQHQGKVNYISLSAISNVTGISNQINQATELAHKYGALIIIDAAQAVPHQDMSISIKNAAQHIDFICFSGHKIYAPSSPGVVVAKKEKLRLMSGQDLGGGSVETVSYHDYELSTNLPDREHSGTPNILGAISLAAVLNELNGYGFDKIEQHGQQLMHALIDGLLKIPGITIYGDLECTRTAALAFNHQDIDHGLLAAVLNDYFGIAVRNECFCAHPYVSSLLKESLWKLDLQGISEDQQEDYINLKRGMVRVSLSLYNSLEDVTYLLEKIKEISNNTEKYSCYYQATKGGSYHHKDYQLDWQTYI